MKARSVGGGRRVLLEKYAFLKRGGKERGRKDLGLQLLSFFLFSGLPAGSTRAAPPPPPLPERKKQSCCSCLARCWVGGAKDGRKLCVCIYMYVSAGRVAAGPRERERERKEGGKLKPRRTGLQSVQLPLLRC